LRRIKLMDFRVTFSEGMQHLQLHHEIDDMIFTSYTGLSMAHIYLSHSHPIAILCLSHPTEFPLHYYNINMEYNSIKLIKFMKV